MFCRFARDAETLRKVGQVLLADSAAGSGTLDRWFVAKDAFEMAEDAAGAIYGSLSGRFEAVQDVLGAPSEVAVSEVRQPAALASGHAVQRWRGAQGVPGAALVRG